MRIVGRLFYHCQYTRAEFTAEAELDRVAIEHTKRVADIARIKRYLTARSNLSISTAGIFAQLASDAMNAQLLGVGIGRKSDTAARVARE